MEEPMLSMAKTKRIGALNACPSQALVFNNSSYRL